MTEDTHILRPWQYFLFLVYMHDSIFEYEINMFSIEEMHFMGGFRSSYFFIPLESFIIRMTRYYFTLLSVNLLSVVLSLKLHMNILQNLL